MFSALGTGLETKDTGEEYMGVSLQGQEAHVHMHCVLGRPASWREHEGGQCGGGEGSCLADVRGYEAGKFVRRLEARQAGTCKAPKSICFVLRAVRSYLWVSVRRVMPP